MKQNHRFGASIIVALLTVSAAFGAEPTVLPTAYRQGQFFAVPELADGRVMRLLVDTGGGGGDGMYWVTAEMVKSLGLVRGKCEINSESIEVTLIPEFRRGRGLPDPIGPCRNILVQPVPYPTGMLGATYLSRRTWTFDYPNQRLLLVHGEFRAPEGARSTPMPLKVDEDGDVYSGMPRVTITVDGQPIDMLLDTGATARPSAQAIATAAIGTTDGQAAGSYITTSVFNEWHRSHPDWPVLDAGDVLFAAQPSRMIRVPGVTIAGWTTGPAWFIERADANFTEFVSAFTDIQVEGAVGGNVLHSFVMTLDYAHRTAWFSCAIDCKPAT
ncbi:hypothetical protein BH10PSE17_BH10PSE17_07730 [soil metagenome]